MQTIVASILQKIDILLKENSRVLIAIDGRCASGKTTLARQLQNLRACNVFHMDDFFLRPKQRTESRLKSPGGNVDYERFLKEILIPVSHGIEFDYQPYDCHTQKLAAPVHVSPSPLSIIEGSYSCHPMLWDYYTHRIFLTIDSETQRRRILARNGPENAAVFQQRWIPLEEQYFEACQIQRRCDCCYTTV